MFSRILEQFPITSSLQDLFRRLRHRAIYGDGRSLNQLALLNHYRLLVRMGYELPSIKDVGFRVHSQHEEDGILLFIFALIGMTDRRCVEICCGNAEESNTANLLLNHRWTGLLFDGNIKNIEYATKFYRASKDTSSWIPTIRHAWITRENVNDLIRENGIEGEIDLLSLDLDGNDYWILKELTVIRPRVIILEFNHLWGPSRSVSIPYNPDFVCEYSKDGSDYAGASLAAFVKLCRSMGYRLVAVNNYSTNAFFVRSDIRCDALPEITPEECFNHPRTQYGVNIRFPRICNREWVEV